VTRIKALDGRLGIGVKGGKAGIDARHHCQ
jgi:hypothetical protein